MKRGQVSVGDLVTFAPYDEIKRRFNNLSENERVNSYYLTTDKCYLYGKIFEVVGVCDGFLDDVRLTWDGYKIDYVSSYMLDIISTDDSNVPDISDGDLETALNVLYGGDI